MNTISFLALQRQYARLGPDVVGWLRDAGGARTRVEVPLLGTAVYLLDADDVYDVLVRRHDRFIKPRLLNNLTAGSFGQGLFTSEGDAWKRRRRLMQPHFHHVHIRHYAEHMTAQAQAMMARWGEGGTRLLDADMHALTFGVVMRSLFSADADDTTDQIATAMHDLGEALTTQSRNPLYVALPGWLPLPVFQQKRRGEKALDRLVRELAASRRALGEADAPRDLLSMLVFSRDEETGEPLEDQAIHDELVTLYIAGHETTALTLDWAFWLLSQHPNIAACLHDELDRVLRGDPPTLDALPNLPYTHGVVKEALRLYPPAWFVSREALEDVTLSSRDMLPKGALVLAISYGTHRDPALYDVPLEFRPERWAGEFEKALPKGAYYPFGMGPRVCIGNGFAMMEAQLVLAALAQRYQIDVLDEPEFRVGSLTLAFRYPVRARVTRRV
jgi:cytochrome P450